MGANSRLSAAFEGRWIRLRPIARSDHPQLFAQRISLTETRLQLLGPPVPTFERWEATELQEVLQGGPALVAEDRHGNYLGLLRLYRLELRDQRSYLEFRLVGGIDEGPALEARWAFIDYAFEFFNLRRVYAEVLSSEDVIAPLLERLGFEEEVRLTEYVRHGDALLDLVYHCLTREAWAVARERVGTSLDISAMAETAAV